MAGKKRALKSSAKKKVGRPRKRPINQNVNNITSSDSDQDKTNSSALTAASTPIVVAVRELMGPKAGQDTGSDATAMETKNPSSISAADLNYLLQQNARVSNDSYESILLLDCNNVSGPASQRKRIKFDNCVNIAGIISFPSNFATKSSVIAFLEVQSPNLTAKLHEPGFYSRMVVFDKNSTLERNLPVISIIMSAMLKWNEKTETNVHILEGGMEEFSKKFPDMVIKGASPSHLMQRVNTLKGIPQTFPENTKEIMNGLFLHIQRLDVAIEATTELISLREKLKSLEAVKKELLLEWAMNLSSQLERYIPVEVKCPVCRTVYAGEIQQCGNGHSICSACCEKIDNCPECELPYQMAGLHVGKVRNRVLERMLAITLRIECTCGEKIRYVEIQSHAKLCVERVNVAEFQMLERNIGSTEGEIEKSNDTLEQVKQAILNQESRWNSGVGSRGENVIPRAWNPIFEIIHSNTANLCSLSTTLLSSVYLKNQCRF